MCTSQSGDFMKAQRVVSLTSWVAGEGACLGFSVKACCDSEVIPNFTFFPRLVLQH